MAVAPRLVTPEAVVLQFETAGLGSRAVALLIDLAIQGFIAVLAFIAMAVLSAPGGSGTAGAVVSILILTFVLLGYPIAFESLWRGRTPGKAALGLRVVTTDGAPIRFRHAAVRGFLVLVDLYLTSGAGAVLSVLVTQQDQRLGDLAAGTLVLRQRSGAAAPRPVSFAVPPGYESYAATLDAAGLGADDHMAIRTFLLRAPSLAAPVRFDLACTLATTVAAHMGHQPPPGLHPEAFLTCVAAVHHARTPVAAPGSWTAATAAVDPGPASEVGLPPLRPPS